jgi:hypothetical protein
MYTQNGSEWPIPYNQDLKSSSDSAAWSGHHRNIGWEGHTLAAGFVLENWSSLGAVASG